MNLSFFVLTLITLHVDCHEKESNLLKNKLIEDIIQKFHGISINIFSKFNPNEKEKALLIINQTISKAVKDLGLSKDERYLDIVMQGLKMIAPKSLDSKSNILRETTHHDFSVNREKYTTPYIATKSDNLVHDIYKLNTDPKVLWKDRQNIPNYIEQKRNKDNETFYEHTAYDDMLLQNNINESRRALVRLIKNINNVTKDNTKEDIASKEFKMVTEDYLKTVTSSVPCETAIDMSCKKLRSVNKLICPTNRIEIPINKLCNGVIDCRDGYDERDCVGIAVEKIKETNNIISIVDSSVLKQCSYTYLDNSMLTKQNAVLGEVLQIQLSFLNERKNSSNNSDKKLNVEKKTVNEITMIISSLSMALEGSFCPQHTSEENLINIQQRSNDLMRYTDIEELAVIPNKKLISPKKCNCERGFCKKSKCTYICKRVCWQKYSLVRWGCQAVIGGNNVALDQICDGKLDCYDGTDETDCIKESQNTKFDAVRTYANILKTIKKKAALEEYSYARKRFLNLYNNIKTLQELSMSYTVEPLLIKPLRDACFTELVAIYEDTLSKGMELVDGLHIFLLSTNEKLVSALKLTHTGNDKIITMDGCYCKDNMCALTKCTRRCDRMCKVEAKLTKYSCKRYNTTSNRSIPIDDICNQKKDCPLGDDEIGCKKEGCRAHHLLLLRHDIRDVGDKQKGTALGELLTSWKTKTVSTLTTAEITGRPTTSMIRDVIRAILRDLVAAYGSFDSTRRASNDDTVLKEFTKISQRVINTLKSCGY